LNVEHDDLAALGARLGRPVGLEASGRSETATYARTFADVEEGGLLVYEDAYKRLSVAVSHGSAAALLDVNVDDELRIRFE
jgi:S-adenosylmethionine hydrolase